MSAELRQRYRERFIEDLRERGFSDADPTSDGGAGQVGEIATPVGIQRIRVYLPEGFPYRRPSVYPLGFTTKRRHQTPDGGALCLWPDEGAGWDPAFTIDDLFARVREWFVHDADGSWPPDDRPPDLHLSIGRTRSRLVVTGDDWPATAGIWGRFAIWDDGVLVLAANARQGNDSVPLTSEDSLVKRYGASKGSGAIGLWFRVKAEPTAPRTLGDLLATVADQGVETVDQLRFIVRGLLGRKAREATRMYFALGYPDPDASRAQEERWLFVDAELSIGADWPAIAAARLHGYESAPGDAPALRRRLGPTDVIICNARIAIFGAGALGAPLALLLAKGGVRALDLYDGDRMRPGHARRHAADLLLTGFTKARATAAVVAGHCPDVDVVTHDTTWDPAEVAAGVTAADVVVDATATPTFSLLLADLCREAGRPLVMLVAHQNGRIGRVQVIRPGVDPCPQCYRQAVTPAMNPQVGADDGFVETGCGSPTSYANAADLEATVNVGARVVLRLLVGTQQANQIFVVNEAVPGGEVPLDREGVHFQTNPRESACTLCGA